MTTRRPWIPLRFFVWALIILFATGVVAVVVTAVVVAVMRRF